MFNIWFDSVDAWRLDFASNPNTIIWIWLSDDKIDCLDKLFFYSIRDFILFIEFFVW